MKVSFTGGSATAWGVGSATFTTGDPLTQFVIEHSDKFADGAIRIERVYETSEPAVARETPALATDQTGEEKQDEGDGEPSDEGENVGVVDVADKSDAIEWLKEHFPERGYTAVKLRTAAAFEAACKECGVVFRF